MDMITGILILGCLVVAGAYVLTGSIVDRNKSRENMGYVNLNMTEREKIYNQFNNAESIEAIDMACYNIKANDCKHEIELSQQKKDEYKKAFGNGHFNDKGIWEVEQ